MARITYTDKTTAATSPLPATQKLTSGDANEIKASVNAAYDQIEEVAGEVAATPKVYAATVAWESGNQPVVTVLKNDFQSAISWASASGGTEYPIATIAGGWPSSTIIDVLPFAYEGAMIYKFTPFLSAGAVSMELINASGDPQTSWADFGSVFVTITVY